MGLIRRLKSLYSSPSQFEEVSLREPLQLGAGRLRVSFEGVPIEISIADLGLRFQLCPEYALDAAEGDPPECFLLFEPKRYFADISGFLRLSKQGDCLTLGQYSKDQSAIFGYPPAMERRALSITHDGSGLIFKRMVSSVEVRLAPGANRETIGRIGRRRVRALRKIRSIFGGPIEALSPMQALHTLRAVNEIMENEAFRARDERGRPGGVVRLPDEVVPIIIGDMHAQVDNLLTLLSHNDFLAALEDERAVLVILGDAVHSEVDGQLDDMGSSMLMMDLLLRLKLRFPEQVFYIRGNHDSFVEDQFKFGVAQCLLWHTALRRQRGEEYAKEMERYYNALPYVILSKDFVACHAAPIRTQFDMDMLVNIYKHPGLVRELFRNRLRRRSFPAGYTKADVRHFRQTLGVTDETPFFVSHSPLSRDETLWLNAGGISNHHIVFSANMPWIGVVTRIGADMIPLSYRREELVPLDKIQPIEQE